VGARVQHASRDPGQSCRAAIIAEAGTGALFGYLLGGVIGDLFPKWYRRY
jgi:hypothetical protein